MPAFIGTLWPVDDLPSALLMTRFYELALPAENRQTLAADAALRTAAIWLRGLDGAGLNEFLVHHEALVAPSAPPWRLPSATRTANCTRRIRPGRR